MAATTHGQNARRCAERERGLQHVPRVLGSSQCAAIAVGGMARAVEVQQEVEKAWGEFHPKSGLAHIELYHACRDNSAGPQDMLRAKNALLRYKQNTRGRLLFIFILFSAFAMNIADERSAAWYIT